MRTRCGTRGVQWRRLAEGCGGGCTGFSNASIGFAFGNLIGVGLWAGPWSPAGFGAEVFKVQLAVSFGGFGVQGFRF